MVAVTEHHHGAVGTGAGEVLMRRDAVNLLKNAAQLGGRAVRPLREFVQRHRLREIRFDIRYRFGNALDVRRLLAVDIRLGTREKEDQIEKEVNALELVTGWLLGLLIFQIIDQFM